MNVSSHHWSPFHANDCVFSRSEQQKGVNYKTKATSKFNIFQITEDIPTAYNVEALRHLKGNGAGQFSCGFPQGVTTGMQKLLDHDCKGRGKCLG